MRPWVMLLCLGHTTLVLTSAGAESKCHEPCMVDPLSRRSLLDKNFMRFGRSSPSFTEEDELKDSEDSLSATGTNKEDNFLRSMRGKGNFIRFGRTRNDNFMRFGRGKQDSFIRFGKSLDGSLMRGVRGKQDNYMRFGRGKDGNFMRFGKGKQDNHIRFGRSKQDNFMRFGRGKHDNFMRLGRGKHDNFMRFGRGKQDNYMRFGRANDVVPNFQAQPTNLDNIVGTGIVDEFNSKSDDFIKFGKNIADEIGIGIPIAMRSSDSNFMRYGRARDDDYMRFGKSEEKSNSLPLSKELAERKEVGKDKVHYTTSDTFSTQFKEEPNDSDPISIGRLLRLGGNPDEQAESELIPSRLKRSISSLYDSQNELLPVKLEDGLYNHIFVPFATLPNDFNEEYSLQNQRNEFINRKKRHVTPRFLIDKNDYISKTFEIDRSSKPDHSLELSTEAIGPEIFYSDNKNPNPMNSDPYSEKFVLYKL